MALYEICIPISFEKMRSIQIDRKSYDILTKDRLISDYTIYEERYKGASSDIGHYIEVEYNDKNNLALWRLKHSI